MNLKDTKAMNYLKFIGCVAKTNLKYLEKEISAEESMKIIGELVVQMNRNLKKINTN
ncbi:MULTISPECIES: hypothetical protein [Bacillus]|uniref:hypothetical protein n=1 Tax=Bacillus TaxID=1386 RepID=UPI000B04B480|nr:hypothetical protein [Bacillus cereus]